MNSLNGLFLMRGGADLPVRKTTLTLCTRSVYPTKVGMAWHLRHGLRHSRLGDLSCFAIYLAPRCKPSVHSPFGCSSALPPAAPQGPRACQSIRGMCGRRLMDCLNKLCR